MHKNHPSFLFAVAVFLFAALGVVECVAFQVAIARPSSATPWP